MEVDDVFNTVINGLYGFTTISIAVFAILGNSIQKKILGIPLVSLIRYNIFMLFVPIVFLTCSVLLMIIFPCIFYNSNVIWIISVIIISFVLIHAKYMLEPIYNEKKFNNVLINKKFKKDKKDNLRTYSNILEELDELKEQYMNKTKGKNVYFDDTDIKNIWNKYVDELFLQEDNISKKSYGKLFDIGFDLFNKNFISTYMDSSLDKYVFIDYLIDFKLDNDELCEFIFNKLYEFHDDYVNGVINLDEYNDLLIKYLKKVFSSVELLNCLLDIILNNNWNKKDTMYIHVYLKNIISNSKLIIVYDEALTDKLDYVLNCFNGVESFDKRYGQNFDGFIKTCFVLIKEEKDNVEEKI